MISVCYNVSMNPPTFEELFHAIRDELLENFSEDELDALSEDQLNALARKAENLIMLRLQNAKLASHSDPVVQERWQKPALYHALPYKFPNGARFETLTARCTRCHHHIDNEDVRGEIVPFNDQMVSVRAIAFCRHCTCLNRIDYRIHDDLHMSGYAPSTGEWSHWYLKTTFANYLRHRGMRMLRQALHFVVRHLPEPKTSREK